MLVRTLHFDHYADTCLTLAQNDLPIQCLIVIDRFSKDRTDKIRRQHGVEPERAGLERAFATKFVSSL
jgi:hypothetical protein